MLRRAADGALLLVARTTHILLHIVIERRRVVRTRLISLGRRQLLQLLGLVVMKLAGLGGAVLVGLVVVRCL